MQIKHTQTFMYNKSVKAINQIKVLKSDSNRQIKSTYYIIPLKFLNSITSNIVLLQLHNFLWFKE